MMEIRSAFLRRSTLALCVAFAASACGGTTSSPAAGATEAGVVTGSSPPPASTFDIDACKLLTSADVQPLLGASATGELVRDSSGSLCRYMVGRVTGVALGIQVAKAFGRDKFDDEKASAAAVPGLSVTAVSGLGDEAFFTSLGYLWVRKGSLVLYLYAQGLPQQSAWNAATAKDLALKVLSRM
jgi:hypothetical protein